jgi:predicted DNA-binding helix-hairpin-helix protein
MCYTEPVEMLEKLVLASQASALELAGDLACRREPPGRGQGCTRRDLRHRYGSAGMPPQVEVDGRAIPIELAVMPGGRRIPLLKTMLTTACERDCLYCPFRAGRDARRVTFRPEELARAFHGVYARHLVDGLFLTTGMIGGGLCTQDRLLDVADILRNRLGYAGYLHLKVMPGVERDQVLQAMRLADRVSVNLEAPTPGHLRRLAPHKAFEPELLEPLRWIEDIRRTLPAHMGWGGHWPSSTTQFVVGPAGESDLDLLATTAGLLRVQNIRRSYFMAFQPIAGTPLEDLPPEEPLREHRLYQSFFLLRDYGFELEDLCFTPDGRLPMDQDPKQVYAQEHLSHTPTDLNRASGEELLRVPGIGPRGAAAILACRQQGSRIRDLSDLSRLKIVAERAAPFITLDGRRPSWQPSLALTPPRPQHAWAEASPGRAQPA